MVSRLFLNQEVYVHFLQRRGENSRILGFSTSKTLRRRTQSMENEWLPTQLAPCPQYSLQGLRYLFPSKGRPHEQISTPAWTECGGHAKTTDLYHHQEGSKRRGRNRSYGGRVAVWRNWRKVPGAPCRWPKKLRWSMKYLHPEESLQSLIVVLVASVLHRPTKFVRSATCSPETFLWFSQTAKCCERTSGARVKASTRPKNKAKALIIKRSKVETCSRIKHLYVIFTIFFISDENCVELLNTVYSCNFWSQFGVHRFVFKFLLFPCFAGERKSLFLNILFKY